MVFLQAVKVAWSGSRRPQRLVSAYSPLACAVAATVAETSAKASSGHRVMRALQILYGMGSAKIQLDEISSSHFVVRGIDAKYVLLCINIYYFLYKFETISSTRVIKYRMTMPTKYR